MEEKELLGVWDVMKKLSLGRDTAYQLMNSNEFHTVKLGRRKYVHKDVLDAWMKGSTKLKHN